VGLKVLANFIGTSANVSGQPAATKAHDRFIDSRAWFCSPAGYCPSFVGDVPTMYDGIHATQAYMRTIAPVLRTALERANALPR